MTRKLRWNRVRCQSGPPRWRSAGRGRGRGWVGRRAGRWRRSGRNGPHPVPGQGRRGGGGRPPHAAAGRGDASGAIAAARRPALGPWRPIWLPGGDSPCGAREAADALGAAPGPSCGHLPSGPADRTVANERRPAAPTPVRAVPLRWAMVQACTISGFSGLRLSPGRRRRTCPRPGADGTTLYHLGILAPCPARACVTTPPRPRARRARRAARPHRRPPPPGQASVEGRIRGDSRQD